MYRGTVYIQYGLCVVQFALMRLALAERGTIRSQHAIVPHTIRIQNKKNARFLPNVVHAAKQLKQ